MAKAQKYPVCFGHNGKNAYQTVVSHETNNSSVTSANPYKMHLLPPSPATITVGHFDHLTIILDLQQLYYITILLTCQHFCSAAAVRNSPRPKIDINFYLVWLGGLGACGRYSCPSAAAVRNSPRPKIDISFCIVWLGGWVPVGDILVLSQRRSATPLARNTRRQTTFTR